QANGTSWVTKLPFPVQVVDKVEVIDHLSKTKLVTTYKYHHGYFDGREREFRGFGRVDQCDTETFEDFTHSSLHDGADLFTNNQRAYHVPPVETRSWFHTGIYFAEDQPSPEANPFDFKELTKAFRKEFYQGDDQATAVDDHKVETGATPHEAYRALRGGDLAYRGVRARWKRESRASLSGHRQPLPGPPSPAQGWQSSRGLFQQ